MSEATIIMTDTGPIGLVQALPDRSDLSDLTENELSWIGFLRAVSDHSDPPPSLAIVQAIRLALGEPRGQICQGSSVMMSPRATFA